MINAAVLAPSAMNLQPWAFAALDNRERIDEYAGRIKSWLLTNFSQTPFDGSLRTLIEDGSYCVFHHAPALVLVLAKSAQSQAYEDCCLAAENLMLAAYRRDSLARIGQDAIIRDWSGPEVASCRDSLYLLVHILQLEIEELSPKDPLFGRTIQKADLGWLRTSWRSCKRENARMRRWRVGQLDARTLAGASPAERFSMQI